MLSNTPRLNFCYLKVIHILHQYYHPKVIGHILKNKQTKKCVCMHHIIRLIIMKMKNKSNRQDINRPKPGYSTYRVSRCCCLYVLSNILAIFEALFMKKLSNIDAESNKSVAYIKKRGFVCPCLEISFIRLLSYLYQHCSFLVFFIYKKVSCQTNRKSSVLVIRCWEGVAGGGLFQNVCYWGRGLGVFIKYYWC